MKTKKILMLLAATGLLGACASEEEARVTGEPVPIRLSTAVEGSQTRTANTSTTGDTELLDGQTVDAYIKVKGGDWLAQPKICTVTGTNGDLTYSGDVFYPMDGTPVSIYAVHPSYTSAATFSVKSDQTDDANYAASDLSYCKTADYNRSESKHTLTFGHVLSKIIVNVQTNLGTVSSVKLRAKKSTTLTYPVDNGDGYTLGTASDVGIIKMNDGGAAIIPPQTTTAEGDVRIIVDIDNSSTFVYNIPASTTFASNTEYTYTVKVGSTITVTSNITPWGGSDTPENTYTGYVTPTNNIKNNPLWYMAQYNLAQNKTSFDAGHAALSQYVFSFNDALQADISGYHQPTRDEMISIIPSDNASDVSTSIFALPGTLDAPSSYSELACNIGGSCVDASTSWFGKNGDGDYYAVRFIGTQFASAWHYKYVTSPCNGLLIESYLIASSLTEAEAKTLLAGLASSSIFTGTVGTSYANQTPASSASTICDFVQRFLPACGKKYVDENTSGTGTATDSQDESGYYWSATEFSLRKGWRWGYSNSALTVRNDAKSAGYSVRLFINSVDPGVGKPMTNVSASDVGKVIAANGKIYATVAQASAYAVGPSGIIAYVGAPGSVETSNATTSAYKCLVIGITDTEKGSWHNSSANCSSQTNNLTTALGYYNGIACTDRLVADGHTHHAATACRNFATPRPSGASEWFLPSLGQWNRIVQGIATKKAGSSVTTDLSGSANATYQGSNLNTVINAAGGTGFDTGDYYYSSTEYSTSEIWRLHFGVGNATNAGKTTNDNIRPVFAF